MHCLIPGCPYNLRVYNQKNRCINWYWPPVSGNVRNPTRDCPFFGDPTMSPGGCQNYMLKAIRSEQFKSAWTALPVVDKFAWMYLITNTIAILTLVEVLMLK